MKGGTTDAAEIKKDYKNTMNKCMPTNWIAQKKVDKFIEIYNKTESERNKKSEQTNNE